MTIRGLETLDDTIRIVVCDDVHPGDLAEIADRLQRLPAPERVEVDFRHVRDCTPSSLLTLATLLAELGHSYGFTGLSSSNRRVLEYLEAERDAAESGLEPPGDGG